MNPREDFSERAFSRAVLADQRVAQPARDLEAHAIECEHSWEPLEMFLKSRKPIAHFRCSRIQPGRFVVMPSMPAAVNRRATAGESTVHT